MKNIHEILNGIGVEIPEDKKADFDKSFSENYKTVAETEKLRTARDNYKEQLTTAQNALKEFENVNVDELQGKIKTLTADLAKKDSDYQAKIADMEFDSILNKALSDSGAKNLTAVKALLDVKALKESKNQAEDINKAIEGIKTDNDYMFTSNEPIKNPVKKTETPPTGDSQTDVMRKAMGLPPKKDD